MQWSYCYTIKKLIAHNVLVFFLLKVKIIRACRNCLNFLFLCRTKLSSGCLYSCEKCCIHTQTHTHSQTSTHTHTHTHAFAYWTPAGILDLHIAALQGHYITAILHNRFLIKIIMRCKTWKKNFHCPLHVLWKCATRFLCYNLTSNGHVYFFEVNRERKAAVGCHTIDMPSSDRVEKKGGLKYLSVHL